MNDNKSIFASFNKLVKDLDDASAIGFVKKLGINKSDGTDISDARVAHMICDYYASIIDLNDTAVIEISNKYDLNLSDLIRLRERLKEMDQFLNKFDSL